jgi:hypothetical protein
MRHTFRQIICALLAIAVVIGIASCKTREKPAAVELKPGAGAAVGYLVSEEDNFSASLIKSGEIVNIDGKAKEPIALQAGDYMLQSIMLERPDASGTKWRIIGMAREVLAFKIAAGQTTPLPYGPPLKVSVAAVNGGSAISVNMGTIKGRAGEDYFAASIRKGDEAAPVPTVQIKDAHGALVAEGSFRYG